MLIKAIPVGPFAMNCYLLSCEETREGALVDPGDEADRILDRVEDAGIAVRWILITHAHLDHIGAVEAVKRSIPAPICMHPEDLHLYQTLPDQGKMFGFRYTVPPPVDRFLNAGETITFGNIRLAVLHTPGHSPGGTCYLAPGVLLSGDTLFAGSVGRTDLPGGSHPKLIHSIKTQLLGLDDATRVYPGHGPATTIGEERLGNPFLQPGRFP